MMPTISIPDDVPLVHLYSPPAWHDEQIIVCNEAGKAALLRLITTGQPQGVCPADGECGELFLVVLATDVANKLHVPYTDEMAQHKSGLYLSDVPQANEQLDPSNTYWVDEEDRDETPPA